MEKLFNLKHLFVAVILAVSSVYAADDVVPGPTIQPNNQQKLIAAPIILKPTAEDKDPAAAAVVVEPTPQPENALEILRNEMQMLQSLEQEKHQKDGWFKSTNKRFAPESMTFFAAIGLVTFNSMWIKSHGDPLAMERHILSLKDPIAHVSFYVFMVANGFYIDFRTKGIDPLTKAQMMHRLSYQGMAFGSLVSSIVSDFGHSGKMCVDYWIMGRNDEKSVAACNQAWKHWTVRNKFQQYFPQIMAMWASQAATEIIDKNMRRSFTKITSTEIAKKYLSKTFLVNTAKKITGADVALTFAGGTWSMKVLRWVGKLTQITMFVAVDHAMSPYTYRPLNNLIRPLMFDFDALAINNYVAAADKINWDNSRIAEANKEVCSVRKPDCLEKRIIEEIENFGVQMQQWREHLNSDAEMDISGWMEMTKKLLNQVSYSYQFYNSLAVNLTKTLNFGYRFRTQQGIEQSGLDGLTRFPFRTLPLYGVGVGPYKTQGANLEDLYLTSTSEIEQRQKEHIAAVVAEAEQVKANLSGDSLAKFNSILSKLKSNNVDEIGKGLIDINQILGVNSLKDPSNKASNYSNEFKGLLSEMRKAIGNPMPVVYPFAGFTQAFTANTAMSGAAAEADFSLWSWNNKYMFNKEADLMTYKVFCGPEKGFLEKHKIPFSDVDYFSPQFNPPSLVKKSKELTEYCSQWRKTRELKIFNENLYGQKIGDLSMSQYFLKNFNYEAIGDYRSSDKPKDFSKWWIENARQSLNPEFKAYDEKFKKLVEITQKNIFDQKGFYKWLVDHLNQSNYLKRSIKENLQFETNFYLQLIARALDESQLTPIKDKYSYMSLISKQSDQDRFSPISGAKNRPEFQKLVDLLNSYYLFIMQDNVSFDQYIAHSKKIDTAINDILVLAKLKNCSSIFSASVAASGDASQSEEVGLMDFSMSPEDQAKVNATPSATGTETSSKTYTDVEVKNPSLRQKTIVAAVQGIRLVESEIRRFIRMKIALSQGLELDAKEFMDDWNNNSNTTPSRMSAPAKANPFGQRTGG